MYIKVEQLGMGEKVLTWLNNGGDSNENRKKEYWGLSYVHMAPDQF